MLFISGAGVIRFSVWLVGGYAHVFAPISVVTLPTKQCRRLEFNDTFDAMMLYRAWMGKITRTRCLTNQEVKLAERQINIKHRTGIARQGTFGDLTALLALLDNTVPKV